MVAVADVAGPLAPSDGSRSSAAEPNGTTAEEVPGTPASRAGTAELALAPLRPRMPVIPRAAAPSDATAAVTESLRPITRPTI